MDRDSASAPSETSFSPPVCHAVPNKSVQRRPPCQKSQTEPCSSESFVFILLFYPSANKLHQCKTYYTVLSISCASPALLALPFALPHHLCGNVFIKSPVVGLCFILPLTIAHHRTITPQNLLANTFRATSPSLFKTNRFED